MDEEDLEAALKIIERALISHQNLQEIANTIKKSCDEEFGKYWNCILGKRFVTDISHGIDNSIRFYL